ncbi:MAG: universal stress protein [Pseudorhodoplanes sp.]
MPKDLLVNLAVDKQRDVAADVALALAEKFGAHVEAVAFAYRVDYPGTVFDGGMATDLLAARSEELLKTATDAQAAFDAKAARAGLSFSSRVVKLDFSSSAHYFGQLARTFDLSIVAQAGEEDETALDLIAEAALFESGRPLLVVPYIQRDPLSLDRVAVCWDGSANAARAANDAMPFLQNAKAVDLVTVTSAREPAKALPEIDILHHLSRYGVKVEGKSIPASDLSVADAVLSYAADSGTTLIVMGGYGHSRMREFVLGGMTRDILASMTVPILMSH